ncbi:N-acylneuraminate cytidylyltransferase [Butyrivibrio sp. FC2001]|uniref:N-acylneuraminate cytidylyltransferase n=1 Tax=Butyrivibrio sp. FC2001 TaxID=1280671 RepID=UPI0004118034|nr:N-acylneuraminate cytidylyltransferase [Butyrivibrio sp. FC2001]
MNVAFIPVRGGSKSIPLKNIKPICGMPLVYWTVKAACECDAIDKVYVATDSKEIKEALEESCSVGLSRNDNSVGVQNGEKIIGQNVFVKLQIIGRSAESASDTASTEFAMLEFAEKYDFDNIVLIQATSPLLTADDLNRGFDAFNEEGTDSVLSVVRQKRFNWRIDEDGFAHPSNYDVFNRPRRQEFDGYFVENGAFYITSKVDLMKTRNRVSGNIKAVEMPEDTFFEIDEPSDWEIIEGLMKKRMTKGLKDVAGNILEGVNRLYTSSDDNELKSENDIPEIKMFLTDCDGCLTDAGMYYSPEGDLLKKYNTKDGMGIRLLRERGILVGIVTGESVDINKRRVEKLKMDIYEPGCRDKKSVVERICREHGISPENVVFVGDDINDLEAMKYVGYPCTVADGHKSVKEAAKYIAKEPGGHGAVRDIIDHILGL